MRTLRFGKHAPKNDYRTLRFKNYLTPAVAAPPADYNVLTDVYKNLKISDPSVLFPMDGNDQYGDCTIAALAHAITVFHGMVGKKSIMSTAAATKLYFKLTGGNDTGLNELDVLNYWRKFPVASDQILAYAKIDRKNHTNIKQSIYLFGGVYLGFQVQQNCQQEFEDKKPWIPGTLTNDGHAVYAVAYDAKTVTVLTWGSTQVATWAWWDECVDEAYALLPIQAKASDFDKEFNFKQLQADLAQVGS